ncbi:MAG: transglycosylase domain-containing protein [Clostridia bacterium]|nr:transglycosylase domain-containing protein [Clostridia bacterium]
MKKTLILSLKILICFIIIIAICLIGICLYSLTVQRISFNSEIITDNNLVIDVFNEQNLLINEENSFNGTKVDFETIPEYVKEAFISIEDKDFYKHNGISLKRIGKATLNNLKNMKIKEGASTISQQLIKNTLLTNEKTLSRKLNEISLAMQLERNFSKNEILENYLNIIYFGSNCYGIESAGQYYFSKSARDLSIAESATLAGMIKSPNFFSPIKNPEICLERRNLVLNEMKKDGKISNTEFETEKNKEIEIKINNKKKNKLNTYSQSAIDEAVEFLKMPEKQIAIGGYKIYTYQNLDNQIAIENLIESHRENLDKNDFSFIDINPKNGGILAYIGKSDYKILEYKRQPGSTVKPLLVYGPAVNEDLISPATLILDEPISIEGYEPKNINDKYYDFISAREALSKSLNASTIKIASYVGLEKIKNYANKLDIKLDKNDNNYALALGGMTYGTNLKQLVGGYATFANKGDFIKPKFVHYITDKDGKIVFKNDEKSSTVFREDSAYLTTDMLMTCATNGTARKLSELPFEVAAKTGTAGTKKGNTDAYNIAYTTKNAVGAWIGNMDNRLMNVAGGNLPTLLVRDYFEKIYIKKLPENFKRPTSIQEVAIDLNEYEINHNIAVASPLTAERYKKNELFSRFNMPKESLNYNQIARSPTLNGHVQNGKAILNFNANSYLKYEIYRQKGANCELIKIIYGSKNKVLIEDEIGEHEKIGYFIVTKLLDNSNNIISEEKSNVLMLYNSGNTLSRIKEKWYT